MACGYPIWAAGQWATSKPAFWSHGEGPRGFAKNVKQLVIAEKTIYSRKPAEVRDQITELMGDLPWIELFARERAGRLRSLE